MNREDYLDLGPLYWQTRGHDHPPARGTLAHAWGTFAWALVELALTVEVDLRRRIARLLGRLHAER